ARALTSLCARMRLRPLEIGDLDALVDLDSDPAVMRYINGGKAQTRAEYLEDLLPRMLAWPERAWGFFAALSRENASRGPGASAGEFLGWFHLRPSVADPDALELGYRLRRAHWGRGLATEGGRALVNWAFEHFDPPLVDACCDPENLASARVMVKCGMRELASFVHPRIPLEVRRFGVTRAEFQAC